MIGSLGFGSTLVSFRGVGEGGLFDPGLVGRVLGNSETKKAVDTVLRKEKKDVKELLEKHQHLVIALRDALLERDELIGDDIVAVLEQAGGRTSARPRRAPRGGSATAATTPSP